ncbi:hypothetical protein BT63DRAFT_223688 [Microthyrium microscopicum]|uniref:Alpha/beta hydrolase fold-3 domain-containing protein n=1 Tax=Microthyrium microscopicum TaxID=703497 RepID=A0A6A6UEF9_9PEZI|nr:hypothetical protein BT63DRAFT_223688 [Microthyrium microscopicum]
MMAWSAVLGDQVGGPDVLETAVAATTYIEVGDVDHVRDECLEFASTLLKGGVQVEFHLRPGCPHLFDLLAPVRRV